MRTQMISASKGLGAIALIAALAACGSGLNSGGSSSNGNNSGNNTGSTTTTGVQIGSGTGSAFQNGVLAIASPSLSAGGSTSITATIVDSTGTLYTKAAVTVTFNSPCFASGQATIKDSSGSSGTSTTSTGTVIMTYTAKGCSTADPVTATTSVGGQSITATGTVTVAPAALGSIVFKSAAPPLIALQGMGGAGLPQTSAVTFTVEDSSGNPVSGANVTFTLVSSTGGVTLSTASASSDVNGNVQTIVKSGTHSGPVEVQASIVVSSTTIHANSTGLAIQSGIPSENFFSISVDTLNSEGFDVDGNTATLTARLADRFGNPVPDGTTVSFVESNLQFGAGGSVAPNCNTSGGTCSVKWTSQNPRPTNISGNQHVGFAYILAFANGEESFTDVNGNGVFDDYRTCPTCALQAEPFQDISEVFAPSAEFAGVGATSAYVPGEVYYDFNSNGIHDPADGLWEGVNCQETAFAKCGTATSTGVGTYTCLVMSGSGALLSNPAPSATLHIPAAGGTETFKLSDENGNVPPAKTVISLNTGNLLNGTATLSPANTGSNFVVPNTSCGASNSSWPAPFSVTATPTGGSAPPMAGTIQVILTTPGGQTSIFTITVP